MQTPPAPTQPSTPIRIVATGDRTDLRREALRPLHLDLLRAQQNLQDLLRNTTTEHRRSAVTPGPSASTTMPGQPPTRPSFAITDESAAIWAGAVASAAHHASTFESPWSDAAETEA